MVEEDFNKAEEAVGTTEDFNKVDSSLSKAEAVAHLALTLEVVIVEVAVKINNNSNNRAVVLNKEASNNNNSHNSKVGALHEEAEEEAVEAGGSPTKAADAKVTQLLIRETCLVRSLRLALDVDLTPIPACTITFVN